MSKASKVPVMAGSIHAIPVPRVDYFPVVITRVPDTLTQERTVFIYVDGTPRPTPDACENPGPPHTWNEAWLGFCTPRAFELGRWPRVGSKDRFIPEDWPVPPATQDASTSIQLYVDDGTMRLVANLAEYWTSAPVCLIQQASAFEKALACRAASRKPSFFDMEARFYSVSEEKLKEWIQARHATDRLSEQHPVPDPCGRQIEEGDLISVPLDCGGFGVVLAARVEPRPRGCQSVIMLGLPLVQPWRVKQEDCQHLGPENAIAIWNSNSNGVRFGDWALIGKLQSFTRERFCIPFHTQFFTPTLPDPVVASTERWGGQDFRIRSPSQIPSHFFPELQRLFSVYTIGGVREDLSSEAGRGHARKSRNTSSLPGPETATLWREMTAWAVKQAASQTKPGMLAP